MFADVTQKDARLKWFNENHLALSLSVRYVASDLVLHCFPMSHKKDTRLIWVKKNHLALSLLVSI